MASWWARHHPAWYRSSRCSRRAGQVGCQLQQQHQAIAAAFRFYSQQCTQHTCSMLPAQPPSGHAFICSAPHAGVCGCGASPLVDCASSVLHIHFWYLFLQTFALRSGFQADGPAATAQALGVLAAIIAVHEFGHFSAARLQGIHVTQFAIGFGPPLIAFKRGEVEYSLRAIPLGGYVAFPDDDPKSSFASDDPDLLQNRNVAQRAVVISAGVVANVLFALAVLFAQMNIVGKAQTSYLPGVLVPEINAGGVAEQAGFQRGDIILRVGDYTVAANPAQVPDLVSTIKAHPNELLTFDVQRGADTLQLQAAPAAGKDGKGAIGVSLFSHTYIKHTMPQGLGDAVTMTGAEFNRLAGTVLNGLQQILTNFSNTAGQLSGPVAIVAAGSEIARTDAAGLYQFCAIVNINLAVVNMLPLPALDGGYLLLLLLEAARGKKLPEGLEQGVMTSGLLLMMVLGVSLAIRDTINLL
eukprot:GHRQ01010273.1.p1 GENE.GHRQ01010273.1~~GHRQ01010273.1.p1  ORF type:complete len:468 (+),score=162.97 GHRQ01010273.1:503-1906(+)